jgi:hypothetical protein
MSDKLLATYESEAIGVLVYEFSFSDKAESDEKIKRRLRRKKLGNFDPDRINLLRLLKDELQKEIARFAKSSYYIGPADRKKRLRKYVEVSDFDIPRLTADMSARFSAIPKKEIKWFVPFSVFVYHVL